MKPTFSLKTRKPPSARQQDSIEDALNIMYKDGPTLEWPFKSSNGFFEKIVIPLPDKEVLLRDLAARNLMYGHELERREMEARFEAQRALLPKPSSPAVKEPSKPSPPAVKEPSKIRKAEKADAPAPKRAKRGEAQDPSKLKMWTNSYMYWSQRPETQQELREYNAGLEVGAKRPAFRVWARARWAQLKKDNDPVYQLCVKLAEEDMQRYRRDVEARKAADPSAVFDESPPTDEEPFFELDDSEDQQVQAETLRCKPADLHVTPQINEHVHNLFQQNQSWLLVANAFDTLWKNDAYFKVVNSNMKRLWQVNENTYFTCERLEALVKDAYSQKVVASCSLIPHAHKGICAACGLTEQLFFRFQPKPEEEYPICGPCRDALELIVEFLQNFHIARTQGRDCCNKAPTQALITAISSLIAITVKMENFKFTK